MSKLKMLAWFMLVVCAIAMCGLPLGAQSNAPVKPTVSRAVAFDVSPPLRELAKLPLAPVYGFHEATPVRSVDFHAGRNRPYSVDPVEQTHPLSPVPATIGLNLLGVGKGFPGYAVNVEPPDVNLAVGDTQVVQWVNSSYAVFDKTTGAIVTGPIAGNHLWSGFGGQCQSQNSGDIVPQWDKLAHRWVLHQPTFSGPPYYACFAISTTPDATGSYYRFAFNIGNNFPDYPKLGVWPDGYYQTNNNFGPGGSGWVGAMVCAYNRVKMLAGDASAEKVCFQLSANDYSILPGDLDSIIAPPSGQDEFYIGSFDVDATNNHVFLYSSHINWTTPSSSTFNGSNLANALTVASYTPICEGGHSSCIPQKGTSSGVAGMGDRLMYRLAYSIDQVASHVGATAGLLPRQHWVFNHIAMASGSQAGERWYEVTAPVRTVTLADLTLFQQGTFAPDNQWRWMGSIARDKAGDLALGYSESSSTQYPSVYFTGRVAGDPLGQMRDEQLIWAGTGTQVGPYYRWGDYSSMALDNDGCTFWYTQEYYITPNDDFDWSTRLASLKFNNCR